MPAGWVSAGIAAISLINSQSGSGGAQQDANTASNAANTASGISQDMWNYFTQNYSPVVTNLIGQAQGAGSPGTYAQAEGAATGAVGAQMEPANKQTLNTLQSYGINPGSPEYQDAVATGNIAEGAAKSGAFTQAQQNQTALAYSKALDVADLGMGLPSQSSASASNAANAASNAAKTALGVNQTQQSNLGYGLGTIGNLIQQQNSGFGNSAGLNPNPVSTGYSGGYDPSTNTSGTNIGYADDYGSMGGYAKGGRVIDAERMPDGSYNADRLKTVLQKHGLHPAVAHRMAHSAARGHRQIITHHMKHNFATGGGVGRSGMPQDNSNMGMPNDVSDTSQPVDGVGTETSDSIPATIDGKEPAALSRNEFVVNASAAKMSGLDMLKAINNEGLRRREHGLQPSEDSNDVSPNAGTQANADGGAIEGPSSTDDTGMADDARMRQKYGLAANEEYKGGQKLFRRGGRVNHAGLR